MPHASVDGHPITAYWQPGCTSCLRMKEFLTKHGVSREAAGDELPE